MRSHAVSLNDSVSRSIYLFKLGCSYSLNLAYRRLHVRGDRVSQSRGQRRPRLTRDRHPTPVGDHARQQFGRVPRVAESRVLPSLELDPQIFEGALEALRSSGVELLVDCPRVDPRGEAIGTSYLFALAFVRQAHVEVPIGPLKEDFKLWSEKIWPPELQFITT